ncbi:MAG: hypothetical protein ACRYFS_04460 [Janthinobacterium lividum]
MSAFTKWAMLLVLTLATLAGCTQTASTKTGPSTAAAEIGSPGVTANSGGDTRGTILYEPSPAPAKPTDPYATVSGKFVLPLRQKMAWELAEIDLHAHQQAENAYPVPDPSSPSYSKVTALRDANHQAQFNAYLLEKYHARFCNEFGVTYDQLVLIIQEGREKNWPMPPVPKE